jgi:hypothetical protein
VLVWYRGGTVEGMNEIIDRLASGPWIAPGESERDFKERVQRGLTRKIDLDDLERDALASPAGLCFQEGQRLRAGSPTCTAIALALVARIRELEGLAKDHAADLAGQGYDRQAEVLREILDKGVVVP